MPRSEKSQRAFETAIHNSLSPSQLARRAALASAPHFALFMDVLRIAFVVLQAIVRRMHADLDCLTLLQGCQAINCLHSIIRIKLTVELHPERITEDELRRLAKASRFINRLARRKIDFSPFTTGSADVPSASTPTSSNSATHSPIPGTADGLVRNPANAGQPSAPSPNDPSEKAQWAFETAISNPQSENPQSLFRPRLQNGLPMMSASYAPGATLANVCQTLARLLKLLPDLEYDPEAAIPPNSFEFPSTGSADVPSAAPPTPANPATPSPATPFVVPPSGGSSAMPAHTATPSPAIPHSMGEDPVGLRDHIPHFPPAPS